MTAAPRDFLPDYGYVSIGGRYRPAFKLFADDNWRMVSANRQPVYYDTAGQAIQAAKDRVKEILNRRILSEKIEPEPVDPLQTELEQFLRDREAKAEAEKRAVFGDRAAKTVFPKRGKPVAVEVKKRRARA